jgi:uncharacterized membrane protein
MWPSHLFELWPGRNLFQIFYMRHYHVISRIAIYLLAAVLFAFGVFHFLYPRDLLVYVPDFLVGGIKWAYVVGGAFILVALSFATNQYVKFASYLLVVLLVFFILTIHVPNYMNAGDKEMKQMALINILKDTAITGFALHIAAGAYHQHFQLENSD